MKRVLNPWRGWKKWPASPLAILAIRLWGSAAVLYGSAVLIGGPDRWSASIYGAVNAVPGSPYSWGVAILAAGLLILTGSLLRRRIVRNIGLYAFAFWLNVFAICFIINAISDSHSPFNGVVLLLAIGGHLLILSRSQEASP